MIIMLWSSNACLPYIWIQVRDLSKGISDLMVFTQDLYTTPEAEVIYYTPGQPGVQSYRLNQQQGIKNNTTSSLSLPH